MPVLGIVIPAYNYAHTLERAVLSALACRDDNTDIQVIVVDDGSTDDTQNLAARLHAAGFVFEYVYQENSGPAVARNRGIDKLDAEFLLFLDADDELLPAAVRQGLATIVQRPDAGILIGGHHAVSSHRARYISPGIISRDCETNFRRYLLDKKINMSNGAMIIRKTAITDIRFPEALRNSEDISVFAQMLSRFGAIGLDAAMVNVNKHHDSLRHNLNYAKEVGEQVVDHIFTPASLPEWAKKYENAYRSQRLLSLFRSHYLSGEADIARSYYSRAIALKFSSLFKWAYLKKYIRLTFSP